MPSSRSRWPPAPRTRRALLTSVGLSVCYSAVVFAYSLFLAPNVSISGSAWHGFSLYSVLAFGTVGVPVFLWRRFRIRSPAVLLGAVLLFWHVLVEFPPVGTGEGDSPGFLFVFVWVPFYLVAYALLAGGEVLLRRRGRAGVDPRRT